MAERLYRISFAGRDLHGSGHGGRLKVRSVSAFVEWKYTQGWRELIVTNEDDVVVGQIGRDLERPSRRIWWAES